MYNPEVIEGVSVMRVEGFTERMKDCLKRVVVSRSRKLTGSHVSITDVSGWVDRLVVIRVAMFDIRSRISHGHNPISGYRYELSCE